MPARKTRDTPGETSLADRTSTLLNNTRQTSSLDRPLNALKFIPIEPSPTSMNVDTAENFIFENLPADPVNLLDLFSVPSSALNYAEPYIQPNMSMDMEHDLFGNINHEDGYTGSATGLIQSLQSKVQDRPLEGTFDWFSWDMYNQDHEM